MRWEGPLAHSPFGLRSEPNDKGDDREQPHSVLGRQGSVAAAGPPLPTEVSPASSDCGKMRWWHRHPVNCALGDRTGAPLVVVPIAAGPPLGQVRSHVGRAVPALMVPRSPGHLKKAGGMTPVTPWPVLPRQGRVGPTWSTRPLTASKVWGWVALTLATLLLSGCASGAPGTKPPLNGGASGAPASTGALAGTATNAEFYLDGGFTTISVINGFTGQKLATLAAPRWAGSFPWARRTTWYPCGASPDDRTFLLCGKSKYVELRLGDSGRPAWTSKPATIPAPARNTGSNGNPMFAVSADSRVAAVPISDGILVMSVLGSATRTWKLAPSDGYATSLSWAGDRYLAFQLVAPARARGAGGVRLLDTRSGGQTLLRASRLIISGERSPGEGITGIFNPVITPDGSKILTAVWTGFLVAGLVEFNSGTGRLIAVLSPPTHMPGHGMPCQVLWTNLSGSDSIVDCGVTGVANRGSLTPVPLFIPNTSGVVVGIVW